MDKILGETIVTDDNELDGLDIDGVTRIQDSHTRHEIAKVLKKLKCYEMNDKVSLEPLSLTVFVTRQIDQLIKELER